jgi:hypothetical protein
MRGFSVPVTVVVSTLTPRPFRDQLQDVDRLHNHTFANRLVGEHPSGGLTRWVLSAVFRFQEPIFQTGPEAGFERLLLKARERNV